MDRSQERTISNFKTIMTRENCQKTMPWIRRICEWFDSQPQEQQRHLGRADFRCERHRNQPSAINSHRCHTFGLAIARQCFIVAVKNSNWRPSKKVIFDLLNQVINYKGNFVICHSKFNKQWRDGGQNTLLYILKNVSEEGINISQQQVDQLLRVLNAIRKRYYRRFFQRAIKYGVSQEALEVIKQLLQQIYSEAKQVKANMIQRNNQSQSIQPSDESSSF